MNKIKNIFLFLLCSTVQSQKKTKAPLKKELKGQIILPIVDVRAYPHYQRSGSRHSHDLNQTTQLLWGEEIIIVSEQKEWTHITIPSQSIFCRKNKKTLSCSGWIPTRSFIKIKQSHQPDAFVKTACAQLYESQSDTLPPALTVSLGTPLRGYQVDEDWWQVESPDQKKLWIKNKQLRSTKKDKVLKRKEKLRSSLLKTCMFFLNKPYCWGGRSTHQHDEQKKNHFSSVDCSGLIQLIYQAHGITVPRNSTGLYFASKQINGNQLLPGDLLFISTNKNAHDIFHVMLYLGNNQLLEASGKKKKIHILSIQEKLKTPIELIKNGKRYKDHYIFCGTFLS
jgi:cell wall-associated NlpC family hydrolase